MSDVPPTTGVTRAEVLRGGLCRGLARRRRGHGQPLRDRPGPRGPAGPAHLRARPRPDRRRGRPDGGRAAAAAAPSTLVLEAHMPYRKVFDVVWSGRRHLMMMATQIDRTGNQNISAIGDWARPKAQLVGVRGAPGNTVNHPTSYWVPDHSTRSFVEQVDVVCGVGYAAGGGGRAGGHPVPRDPAGSSPTSGSSTSRRPTGPCACARCTPGSPSTRWSRPPGSSWWSPTTSPTPGCPTAEELELIREVLDPRGSRDREMQA